MGTPIIMATMTMTTVILKQQEGYEEEKEKNKLEGAQEQEEAHGGR